MDLSELLLYRDALVLVLDKPTGMAVHAGSGKTNALDRFFYQLRFGLPQDPTLAHRLDKPTSGCLVLARHRQAATKVQQLFAQGKIEKTYVAWVYGGPEEDQGLIDLPLAPLSEDKNKWHMGVDPAGKPAQTRFDVLKRSHDHTLLRLFPLTGRTHQLRVHCAAEGFPIVGDYLYEGPAYERLLLHAESVALPLYKNKPPLKIEAPWPYLFHDFTGETYDY